MPIYLKSKQVKGLDFLQYNGKSYTRTGKHLPKGSTITTPVSDIEPFYVTSCSATDFGNQIIIPGGTVTVPYTATEFQLKFTGKNHKDNGFLILEDEQGRTCTVHLSVNALSGLVFDVAETGTPAPHVFSKNVYPTTLDYVDCMSHKWKVTYASLGSYYLTLNYQGQSIFKCGEAEIDLTSIYKIGSDNRTGLGGQVQADHTSNSPGYSLQYKTLNYGVDTTNGSIGRPIVLQDVVDWGHNVEIFMKGTGGTGAAWEAATGENLNTNEWGLSTTAGGFNNGNTWEKLTFPTGTYSTSATITHGNSARICFAGTTPTTTGAYGDKYFTVLKELIDVKSVPVGGSTDVQVEHDGETFIKFEGTNPNETATAKLSSPVGMTCSVVLSVNAAKDLVFDATSVGSGPLVYTSFPQSKSFTDCHGDTYDVIMTGLGSFSITIGNMKPFIYTPTGNTRIDARTDAKWINYNVVGTSSGKYEMAKSNWSNIKTPNVKEPVAQLVEENPTIEMTVGDGVSFATSNLSAMGGTLNNTLSVMDNHPIWIKTVRSPGVPGVGETPPGVLINNGTPDQGPTYRYVRFRPVQPGTYYYNCEHHASMSGEIIVSDIDAPAPPQATPTPTPTPTEVGPFTYEYEFTHYALTSDPTIQWWDSTVLASPPHRTGRQVSAGINHYVIGSSDKYSKQPVICIHKNDTIRIKNSAGGSHPMEMKLINNRPSVSDDLDTAALEALWGTSGSVISFSNDTDFTTIPSQDSNRFGDVVSGQHQLDTGDINSGPGWIYMIRCANHHSMAWFLEIKNETDEKCPGLHKNPADASYYEEGATPEPTPTPTPTPSPTCEGPGHVDPFPTQNYWFTDFVPAITFSHTPGTSAVSVSANWSEFWGTHDPAGSTNMDISSWTAQPYGGRMINFQPDISITGNGKPSGYTLINDSSEDLILGQGSSAIVTIPANSSIQFDPDDWNNYVPGACRQTGGFVDWQYKWAHWPSWHYGWIMLIPVSPEHPNWPTVGNSR